MLSRLAPFRILFAHRRMPWVLAVVAGLLALPSLNVGYASDDHLIRWILAGFPGAPELQRVDEVFHVPWDLFVFAHPGAVNEAYINRGILPWWSPADLNQRIFHPLVGPFHWFDYHVLGDRAWLAHLHSIAWYLAAIPFALAFYRRIAGVGWVAGLATWIYILDDARGMPIGWLASRHIFFAVSLGFVTLWAHDRWRSDKRHRFAFIACAALALALGFAESAVATCAFLFAYALCLDRGPVLGRAVSLLPYAAVVVAWRVFYLALEFGSYGSGIYVDMGRAPLEFAAKALAHWPILALGVFGRPNAIFFSFLPAPLALAHWCLAVLAIAAVLILLFPVIRRDRILQFAGIGTALALLPLCATIPDDRLGTFPAIGSALFVARFFQLYFEQAEDGIPSKPFIAKAWAALAVIWFLVHLVHAPLFLPVEAARMGLVRATLDNVEQSLPSDRSVTQQHLIALSAPADWLTYYVVPKRSANGAPIPLSTPVLYAGPEDLRVTRTAERELLITCAGGWLPAPYARLFRNPDAMPFRVGDTCPFGALTAQVVEINEDGQPVTVRFTAEKSLDGEPFRWFTWRNGEMAPVTLPLVGETTAIEGSPMPLRPQKRG